MSAPRKLWIERLPRVLVGSLSLIAILTAGHELYLDRQLDELSESSSLINTSGRQRMLLQRTALLAQLMMTEIGDGKECRQRLLETIDEMEAAHRVLLSGSRKQEIEGIKSPSVLAMYREDPYRLDWRVRGVIQNARSLAEVPVPELTPDHPSNFYLQEAATGSLLEGLDMVTRTLEAEAKARHQRLRSVELRIMGASVLLLVSLGAFVFRPLGRLVNARIGSLTAENESLSESLSETQVSSRKQESEIRKRTLREDSILQSLAEGVLVCDGQGRIRLTNPALHAILDDDPTGSNIREYLPTQEWFEQDGVTPYPLDRLPVLTALKGQETNLEVLQIRNRAHPSGLWLSINARPLINPHGRIEGVVTAIRDINVPKQSRDELEAGERRMRLLLSELPAIMWTTDKDLQFTSTQGRGLKDLGLEPDELVGMTMHEFFETRNENFKPLSAQRRANKGEPLSYEFSWKDRNYQVHVEPLQNGNGKDSGSIGIALDMTEVRHAGQEFAVARAIQQKLFPLHSPGIPGFDIAGCTYPADSAAGDYFDYIPMPRGRLGLVVGDVSGHGVGPALIMAETRAYLRALSLSRDSLERIMNRANLFLLEDTDPDRYVTLFFGELDPREKTFAYVSAGHPSGYILNRDCEVKATLESSGVPLGLFSAGQFKKSSPTHLNSGDLILLLTDGVTEACCPGSQELGFEATLDAVREHAREPAADIVQAIRKRILEHCGIRAQQDDITLMVIKVA